MSLVTSTPTKTEDAAPACRDGVKRRRNGALVLGGAGATMMSRLRRWTRRV
jgi:hypothetical protein